MEPYELRAGAGVPITSANAAERVSAFLRRVYGWMGAGLAITALVAFVVVGSPALLQAVFGNRLLFYGLIIAQLGLVFFLSGRAQSLAPSTAALLFVLYSALTGVTLSVVLLAYTGRIRGHHLRRDGGHVRGAGRVRDDDLAKPGRGRSVLLHGADRARAGVGARDVLAQRRAPVLDLGRRRPRLHRADRVRRAAPAPDGPRGSGGPGGLGRDRGRPVALPELHQPLPLHAALQAAGGSAPPSGWPAPPAASRPTASGRGAGSGARARRRRRSRAPRPAPSRRRAPARGTRSRG